jgi:hypothetical protein
MSFSRATTITVLFVGSAPDPNELEAVTSEARRLGPTARIFLRAPTGTVTEWPNK